MIEVCVAGESSKVQNLFDLASTCWTILQPKARVNAMKETSCRDSLGNTLLVIYPPAKQQPIQLLQA